MNKKQLTHKEMSSKGGKASVEKRIKEGKMKDHIQHMIDSRRKKLSTDEVDN